MQRGQWWDGGVLMWSGGQQESGSKLRTCYGHSLRKSARAGCKGEGEEEWWGKSRWGRHFEGRKRETERGEREETD